MNTVNTLKIAHRFISERIKEGDFWIDATAGRGNDTLFLSKLVGESGKVIAFDIQSTAIESTKALLEKNGVTNAEVIKDSHHNMDSYAKEETVDGIVFNFGYLPGGDHNICTKAESSIMAIEKGLSLLKVNGVMSLCIYYGGDSGFEEKDALMEYLKTIDSKKYTVVTVDFYNRPNCPPIAVFITRDA